ncbi:hypothetical protein N7491_005708 [Penicillium cf. griseofulvum]|nr:hypothetical protein N7491_005708 [Penicillium cf. griseofulvum]
MTKYALSASEVSLRDRWILDSGSSAYVCNNKDLFVNLRLETIDLRTGDGSTRVLGRGTVRLIGKHPEKGRLEITLSDALYSPIFHTNLVLYAQLKKKGGSRTRRARRDDDYAYATTIKIALEGEEPPAFLHAFAAGLYAEKLDTRCHRDDLLPPPKHWKEVLNHPFQ